MKKIITILFTSLLKACSHHIDIAGKWKRVGSQNNIGDLTLSSDSTFFINGDHRVIIDSIQGWHHDDKSGTWQLQDKKYLILNLDPKEEKIWLSYKILALNKGDLVILSVFDPTSDSSSYMKFKR